MVGQINEGRVDIYRGSHFKDPNGVDIMTSSSIVKPPDLSFNIN